MCENIKETPIILYANLKQYKNWWKRMTLILFYVMDEYLS